MLNILGLIALWIGSWGGVYTARGLRGLFVRRNAKEVNMLIDSLGRMDLLFSEGHFDLLLDRVYGDLAIAKGCIFLFVSLVLSFVAGSCTNCTVEINNLCCLILISIGAVIVGIVLGLCTLPCLRKRAIKSAAKEIEARACEAIQRKSYTKKAIEQLLGNWFHDKVGRDPNLKCQLRRREVRV